MSANTPKEIGRLAGRAFQAIVPKNWAIRSQEDQEDYGVDYEIELTTSEDKATGFIFKIQQKGVEKATRLIDGTISFKELSTEKVTYYLKQLRIPIIFVVVDLESNKSYWIPLHANRAVETAHAEALANGQKKMTVHLPAKNVLPETADALLAAVKLMMDALTLEGLKAMPTANAQAIIDSEPNIEELEKGLRFTQSLVRSARTQRLIENGKYKEAFQLNDKAFRDDAEPVEVRFSAGMEVVRIGGGMLAQGGGVTAQRGREELIKLRLQVHHALVRICRALPSSHQLRFYSLFLARASRLRVYVHRDVGLFFSRLAQEASPDEYARYVTAGAQRKSTLEVTTELHRAQRLIVQLIEHGWIGLVVYAWADLTEALMPFLTRLEKDGLAAGAVSLREWLHSVGTLCRELVVHLNDGGLVGLCALNHARIDIDTDAFPQRLKEARALIVQITDARERSLAEAQLEKQERLVADKSKDVPEEDDQEAFEQIVRQMAHGLGINIDDPNDEIAGIVRVGLQDANPERVLRDCKHLVVQLGAVGVPAQMLGLPTAGFKDIACRKHGYRSSGFSLDQLYGFFQSSHCDGCPDRDAHPPGWKWTRAWQEEQELGWEQDLRALRRRFQDESEAAAASSKNIEPRTSKTSSNADTRRASPGTAGEARTSKASSSTDTRKASPRAASEKAKKKSAKRDRKRNKRR